MWGRFYFRLLPRLPSMGGVECLWGKKSTLFKYYLSFFSVQMPPPPFWEGEGWVCLKLKQVVSAQQSLMLGGELRSDDSSECEALT